VLLIVSSDIYPFLVGLLRPVPLSSCQGRGLDFSQLPPRLFSLRIPVLPVYSLFRSIFRSFRGPEPRLFIPLCLSQPLVSSYSQGGRLHSSLLCDGSAFPCPFPPLFPSSKPPVSCLGTDISEDHVFPRLPYQVPPVLFQRPAPFDLGPFRK